MDALDVAGSERKWATANHCQIAKQHTMPDNHNANDLPVVALSCLAKSTIAAPALKGIAIKSKGKIVFMLFTLAPQVNNG
jgi:hypothetical protein